MLHRIKVCKCVMKPLHCNTSLRKTSSGHLAGIAPLIQTTSLWSLPYCCQSASESSSSQIWLAFSKMSVASGHLVRNYVFLRFINVMNYMVRGQKSLYQFIYKSWLLHHDHVTSLWDRVDFGCLQSLQIYVGQLIQQTTFSVYLLIDIVHSGIRTIRFIQTRNSSQLCYAAVHSQPSIEKMDSTLTV